MKDPAALIYIDKWIAATQGMKGNMKGWYLDLILHQYDKGSLPNDIDELASICRIRPSEYGEFEQVFKQVLEQKFIQNDSGRLENDFAKEIIQGRQAFKEKRSNSGKWSYAKKFILKHYGRKSQNEMEFIYENFDFSIDLKNEQVFKQVLEHIFELYINVNEDVNINEFKNEFKEGVQGEKKPDSQNVVNVPREAIEERLTCALDEIYLDSQRPKWSHIDFDIELMGFQEKVRGSPEYYVDHDVGRLRLAFQAQLRNARRKPEAIAKPARKELSLEQLKAARNGTV